MFLAIDLVRKVGNCWIWGLILSLGVGACSQKPDKTKDTVSNAVLTDTISPTDIAGKFSDQVLLHFDSSDINTFLTQYPDLKPYQDEYIRFYSGRKYAYAWHNKDGMIEQAGILYNHVLQQRDNGVANAAPYFEVYTSMMEEPGLNLSTSRELMITGQYLNYANKVITGISESDTRALNWYIPRKKMDYTALLDSILTGNADTRKLMLPMYYKLQEKLKIYYDIEKKGNWVTIVPDRKKYQLGDSSPVVREIRKKLFLAGDIPKDSDNAVFDIEMENGIKELQRRYGLKEDGVAGPAVLREMAAPLSRRIEQIVVNMERCRWIPNETNEDYLYVNIPQFTLIAMEQDSIAFRCNVVVGTATNKTVIFRGDMKYIVFSPYWNVPQSIVRNEILPAIKKNPNYLAKHNMEKVDGKYRQKPGPANSLGLVKFLFPNSYNIYLHDTPSKSLFNEDKRAFSHGCIRVSQPFELAKYLLRHDQSWTPEKISAAMNSGKEQYVTLKKTVPVYLVYFTAFVDSRGKLNFREDIYNRDQAVKEMLFSKNANAMK